jgi:hypothetical protein
MKNTIIIVLITVLVIVGVIALRQQSNITKENGQITDKNGEVMDKNKDKNDLSDIQKGETETVIGNSVEDRDIIAYHYGTGDEELLFIGGISGGYSWNTVLTAYAFMDYLDVNANTIPENLSVTVVPVLNPDGLFKVTGKTDRFTASDVNSSLSVQIAGRFNANNVDLNRNFDCDWKSEGIWQSRTVSGGVRVFSEPESKAIKVYIESSKPKAVVVWYSAAGGVFASSCNDDILPETQAITDVYALASGYPAYQKFTAYPLTGDMTNWLAKMNIPAISVLLTDHENAEWAKNQRGINALFAHYGS